MFEKLINRTVLAFTILFALFVLVLCLLPKPVYAANAPQLGNTWTYSPPTGGLLNTTAVQTVTAAKGSAANPVTNLITGGECYAEALGAATELVLLDGATVIWRLKIPAGGWPTPIDINFLPYIRGTPNTAVNMQTLTASVTGAVYCNWRGGTDQ